MSFTRKLRSVHHRKSDSSFYNCRQCKFYKSKGYCNYKFYKSKGYCNYNKFYKIKGYCNYNNFYTGELDMCNAYSPENEKEEKRIKRELEDDEYFLLN